MVGGGPLAAGVLARWGIAAAPGPLGRVLISLSTIIVAINAQLLRRGLKLELEIHHDRRHVQPRDSNRTGDVDGPIGEHGIETVSRRVDPIERRDPRAVAGERRASATGARRPWRRVPRPTPPVRG